MPGYIHSTSNALHHTSATALTFHMILGLGVDILSLTRFESVIARRGVQRVARRVCCARELADFHTKFGTDRQIWTTRDDAFSFSPASEAEAAFQENEAIKRRAVRFLSSR